MKNSLLFAAALVAFSSASSPTARDQLTQINKQAQTARQANDKPAYLRAALDMQTLLNDAPNAVKAVARAYADAGDPKHALASLSRFAEMGQADDSIAEGKDQRLTSLHDLPEFKKVLDRFKENQTPVSAAKIAFSLPDPGILAEDIDFDAHSQSFFITSVLERKIIRVSFDGKAQEYAQSPSHWPMMAVKADAKRNKLWATEVAIDEFTAAPKSDWGRSALLCFELATGKLLSRVEGPSHTALGDMVLTPDGDPIVSDGDGGGVYRLVEGQFKLIDDADFISPQTAAMLPDGRHAFVPDYLRGIGILNLETRKVTWLKGEAGKTFALNGIDGLYFSGGSLILTQNGTSPVRVVRLQLNSVLDRIVSEDVIERATDTLGDPTHGVIVGDDFYYIANSGWSNLDDHGDVKSGSSLTPAHIMRYRLR
jgi:hypothetical protein